MAGTNRGRGGAGNRARRTSWRSTCSCALRGRRGHVPGERAGGDAQDGALSAAGRPCFGSRTGQMADDGPPPPARHCGRQPAAVVEDRSADPRTRAHTTRSGELDGATRTERPMHAGEHASRAAASLVGRW
jgi:hypothetical protein